MSNGSPMRRALLPACLSLLIAALALPAQAQTSGDAHDYVQANIQTALSILQDKSVSDAARRERIHAFLLTLLDTRRIALYTLGGAQQTASPSDLATFIAAFRDFMVANYDSQLGGYEGQSLKVTASVEHAPGDYVVSAVLVDPAAESGDQALEVDLQRRQRRRGILRRRCPHRGHLARARPAQRLSGLSCKEHNGDVAALTAHLKEMTAKLQVAGN
jgi:ABC-type transporter MlaC component